MSGLSNFRSIKQFIAIDDDHATLFMCKVIIQRTFKDMPVITYSNPQVAVDYFQLQFADNAAETVVLLDINMPELTGWDVLDNFYALDDEIKKYITVIMLSSSIDPNDRKRALDHSCVKDYLEKPLTLASLEAVMEKMKATKPSLDAQ